MGIHPEQGLFVLQVRPPTELSVSRQHFLGFILHNVTPLGAPQKTSLQRLSSPLRMMTKMFNKTSCVAGASEFHGTESPNCSLLFLVHNIHGIFLASPFWRWHLLSPLMSWLPFSTSTQCPFGKRWAFETWLHPKGFDWRHYTLKMHKGLVLLEEGWVGKQVERLFWSPSSVCMTLGCHG